MVIGSGLMAKTFSNYENSKEVLIFASGVSNSTETDPKQFNREYSLLKNTIALNPDYLLVYFSTLSIEDESVKKRPYIKHKLQLENYIKNHASKYIIARVSNVVGPVGNSHTIINYLVNAIKKGEKLDVWKLAERNIIDKEDVKFIIDELLKKKCSNKVVNVALSENILVTAIVSQIELYLQKKANAIYLNKGNKLSIDISVISEEITTLEKRHGKGIKYLNHLLKKYY